MPRHPPCALTTNTPPIRRCATRKTHTKQHKKQEIKQKNDFASTIQFSHNTTPPPATIMITSRQGRKIPQLIVWDTQQPHQAPHPHYGYTPHILPRKEVIQPHLPVRLPCYDFVPIANPTFDHSPHQTVVRPWASGVTNFHDVTGGVYKARERIHRSIADLRLLATPTSWGRVADPNPN